MCVSEREHIIMQSCFNHIKLLAVLFSDIANTYLVLHHSIVSEAQFGTDCDCSEI